MGSLWGTLFAVWQNRAGLQALFVLQNYKREHTIKMETAALGTSESK